MIVSIPLNTLIARFLKKLQEEQMKNRDKRTRLMSELLANIRRFVVPIVVKSKVTSLTVCMQHQAVRLGERLHPLDLGRQEQPRIEDA